MFYDASVIHRPWHADLLKITFRPWQMFSNLLDRRRTHAILSDLDDRLLRDIGISRGSIRTAICNGRPDYSI